jgi:hypothetical protein
LTHGRTFFTTVLMERSSFNGEVVVTRRPIVVIGGLAAAVEGRLGEGEG